MVLTGDRDSSRLLESTGDEGGGALLGFCFVGLASNGWRSRWKKNAAGVKWPPPYFIKRKRSRLLRLQKNPPNLGPCQQESCLPASTARGRRICWRRHWRGAHGASRAPGGGGAPAGVRCREADARAQGSGDLLDDVLGREQQARCVKHGGVACMAGLRTAAGSTCGAREEVMQSGEVGL